MKRKTHKKLFFVCLIAIMSISLGACGRSETAKKQSEPKIVSGITDKEIIVGSSSALTGHAGYLGTNYLAGALSYFKYLNDAGGINGRMIRVISYDDQYDPAKCVFNTQKLINEDKVFALFNYVGTPTSVKIIPIVEQYGIPLVGLFTGANDLRNPVKKYIFNIRGSYYHEIRKALLHFHNDLGLNKIAVFYQNDAYGLDGLKGAEIASKQFGVEIAAQAHYERGTLDVEKAVEKIIKSEAQVIVMVGTYSPCAKFIRLCREKGFNPFFHNVSFVGAKEFAKELGEYGEGVIVSQVVPHAGDKLLSAAKQYKNLLSKYYPKDAPNFVGMEGFVNAKVLAEGLRLAGRDLTRGGLIKALESLKDYSVGIGDSITFSPDDHQGLEFIYFTRLEKGQWKFFTDWEILKK